MQIGITGSTGLIGSALREHLTATGHVAVPIVRREAGTGEIAWDPSNRRLDPADVAPLDAIVHLAGASIGGKRWNARYRQVIRDSRVDGTALIADTLAGLGTDGPQTWLSGSAIGIYGDRGDEVLDEGSELGEGFLADVCRAWEGATAAAEAAGVRVAHLRTGIVLSEDGGALPKMLPLFKFGVGGRFGSGRQWMSWISIVDEVRAIAHLLTSSVSGAVNLTAPAPVRNREFADTLGDVLRRPSLLPVPAFGPKLLLGSEMADALLFDGQRLRPQVLLDDGFRFEHDRIDAALRAVLGR